MHSHIKSKNVVMPGEWISFERILLNFLIFKPLTFMLLNQPLAHLWVNAISFEQTLHIVYFDTNTPFHMQFIVYTCLVEHE